MHYNREAIDGSSMKVLLRTIRRWIPERKKLGLGDRETAKPIPVDGESQVMECNAAQATEDQLQEESVKVSGRSS